MQNLAVFFVASAAFAASALAADMPNAHLLPVTKAIYEGISKTPDPDASAMQPYTEKPTLTKGVTFDLVPIPGGEFKMGSQDSEKDRKPDEGPQKLVKISPFWMGKYEITWGTYESFQGNQSYVVSDKDGKPILDKKGQEMHLSRNKDGSINVDADIRTIETPVVKAGQQLTEVVTQPTPPFMAMNMGMGDGYTNEYPAIQVTLHAANKFCEWMSAQTGHFYRLPTEAEWEYACRAGTTTAYSFGDDPAKLGDYGWCGINSAFSYQKVGKKKPNPWGLFDMYGNACELTLDLYGPSSYAERPDGISNPFAPALNRYPTAVRGGSWNDSPAKLRSAARTATDPKWKLIDPQRPRSLWYFTNAPWVGFRVVRPLKTPTVEEMHAAWNSGPGVFPE